jgi:LysM repeat protein
MQLRQIKNLKSRIRHALFLGALCLALLPWSSAAAQQGTSNNLLQNPGFEGEYQVRCSYPGGKAWITLPCDSPLPTMPWQTARVAPGWAAWWQPPSTDRSAKDFYQNYPNYCGRDAPDDCVAWHNPEFGDTKSTPQDPPRIRSGENSQKYFTFWSVHEGGLYQVVEDLRPGTPLRFSVYMEVWSATKLSGIEPNPHQSFGQTNMHLRVGIDPTGGTDPWSKAIVWSPEHESYDQFTRFEVQAVAQSNKVTVFTHSRPENPMEHNDVYVDDAELWYVGGVGPSAPLIVNPPPALQAVGSISTTASSSGGRITHIVQPGDTLFALALQYGVPVDQILTLNGLMPESQIQIGRELIIALPTAPQSRPQPAAPAPKPMASVGGPGSGRGAVCVQAFDDANADGRRLITEAPVSASGVRFIVSDIQGRSVADHTLSDPLTDFCFTELPATIYRVVAELPAGYVATTQPRWSVSLTGDATVDIQLGVRVDTASQSTSISSAWLFGAGGLVIAAIAGVWFWQRRK